MTTSSRILSFYVDLDKLENVESHDLVQGNCSKVKTKFFIKNEKQYQVVLKKMKNTDAPTTNVIKYFLRESLNQIILEYPTILPNYGWNLYHYCDAIEKFVYSHRIITPYCEKGLGEYLKQLKEKDKDRREDEEYSKEIQTQQYIFLYGIARGFKHLYRNGVIHRDLKTENIFICQELNSDDYPNDLHPFMDNGYYVPYIADLGFSKAESNGTQTYAGIGTPYYEAPEQMTSKFFSFPADVYAYAVVASDIFSLRAIPVYSEVITKLSQLRKYIYNKKKRPVIDDSTKVRKAQKAFCDKLWDHDPLKRPTFINVVKELEAPIVINKIPDDFIFDDLDLDAIKSYKLYIDWQLKSKKHQKDESTHEISVNEVQTIIDRLPKEYSSKNRIVKDYITGTLRNQAIEANPQEFYKKKGEEFEAKDDIEGAISSYKRAITFGSRSSIVRLALMLLKSSNERKKAEGFELIEFLSEQEDKDAIFYYAYLTLEGFSACEVEHEADQRKSAELFEKAGKLGHPKGYVMAAKVNLIIAKLYEEIGKTNKVNKYLNRARKCYSWSYIMYKDEESYNVLNPKESSSNNNK